MRRLKSFVLVSVMIAALLVGRPAHAVTTLGDAALTVSVSALTGAVLGFSTLPFYDDSNKHTKNIFYGAAVGAVVGVFIAAYAGVQDTEEESVLRYQAPADARFAFSRQLEPEQSTAKFRSAVPGNLSLWSPIAKIDF